MCRVDLAPSTNTTIRSPVTQVLISLLRYFVRSFVRSCAQAGKITGMILQSMGAGEIARLLRAGRAALEEKVAEAKRLLDGHQAAVQAADYLLVQSP